MPNLETGDVSSTPDGSNVVLSSAQYDELRQQAGASGKHSDFLDPKKNVYGLIFVAVLVLSFVIPGLSLLTFPLIIFGIMAMFGIFKDARFGGSGKRSNPVVLVFKLIGAVVLGGILVLGALIAFLFISLSTCNCKGS